MLAIIFYSIITLISLFFLGYGVTVIFTPKSLEDYRLWLIPWIGLIFLTVILTIFSLLGFSISQIAVPIFFFLIVLNGWVFIKTKKTPLSISREDIAILMLIAFVMVFTLSVLIIKAKFLTTISMGSNDVVAYAITPDYLLNHSVSEILKVTAPRAVDDLIRFGFRWGPSLITAFLLYFFRLAGYQYVSIVQPVLFSLSLPLAYIVFRILFRKKSFLGLIFIILGVGLNVNILYILYHNFFGQILFAGFQFILFIFCSTYFDSREFKSHKVSLFDVLVALTLTAIIFSYHEGLVIIIPVFFIIFARSLIYLKNKKDWLFSWLKMSALVLLFSSYSFIHFVYFNFFYRTGSVAGPIGWQQFRTQMPFANLYEMMGFYSIHSFAPLPTFVALFLMGLTLLFMIDGYVKSRYRLLLSSFLRVYCLFLLWFGFVRPHYFVYNRLVTLLAPFLMILFCIGFLRLFSKKRITSAVLLIIFLSLISFNALKLNARYLRESIIVGKELITLKNLANSTIVAESIYAENMLDTSLPVWNQIWADYFLSSKKDFIFFAEWLDKKKLPNQALILISKQPIYYNPLQVSLKNVVWDNEYYQLGSMCPSDECFDNRNNSISFNEGWAAQEIGHRWTTSKVATMYFGFKKGKKASQLVIEALTLKAPQQLDVYIDEQLIGQQAISAEWQKYKFDLPEFLSEGSHKLSLNISHLYTPSEILKNGDTRKLGIDVKSIMLIK